jgi:hypothetical protein
MKKLLGIIVLGFLLSGCAGPQDGVLSSLLMGGVFLLIIIISVFIHYIIKASKILVGITPEVERKRDKKKFNEARKNYLKQILNDRKFVKLNYSQYTNKHKRKYPENKYPKNKVPNANSYLSKSGWANAINNAKERIKSHELYENSRKIQNLTDKEFVKLPFEKSGYSDQQIWVDRWAKAKGRVDRKKYRKSVKLLRVRDYERI